MRGRWAPEPGRARPCGLWDAGGRPEGRGTCPREVEVAVVGGGPAGVATALGLARLGRRVAVLSRAASAPAVVETLPPEVRSPLAELGLWEKFLRGGPVASPGGLSYWGEPEAVEVDFIANPSGCGWHVDRREFDAMLAGAVEEAGGHLLAISRPIPTPRRIHPGWSLEAVTGGAPVRLLAAVLVDASGRPAMVARRLGARRIAHDRLVGVVASRPASGRDGDRRMLVESVEEGWWYTAPRPGGGMVAAFMTDADLLPGQRGLMGRFFADRLRLAPETASRFGGVGDAKGFRIRLADSSRLDRAAGDGWLAVGDAASAWDPLSSQGVYRALATGLDAARALDRHLGGDRSSLGAHAARVGPDFEEYLASRSSHYARERRWPSSPFWRRRHHV